MADLGAAPRNAPLADTYLASPTAGLWKTISEVNFRLVADQPGLTAYIVREDGVPIASPLSVSSSAPPPKAVWLDADQHTVAGKAARLRVVATTTHNATATTNTVTTGLRPVTLSGAADVLVYTVTGSYAAPANIVVNGNTSTAENGVGTDVAFPTDGLYVWTVETLLTVDNNSAVGVHAALQIAHT